MNRLGSSAALSLPNIVPCATLGLDERLNGSLTSLGELAQLQLALPWELPGWFRDLCTRLPLLGSKLQVAFERQSTTRRPVILLSGLQIRDEMLLFEPGRSFSAQGILVLAACGRRTPALVVLQLCGPNPGRIGLTTAAAASNPTLTEWSDLTIHDWLLQALPADGPRKPRQRFPARPKPRPPARRPAVAAVRCQRSLPLFLEPGS
jgi:hypothetical protein